MRAAVIQMNSQAIVADNLAKAEKLILEAVSKGAELVVLPENFAFIGAKEQDKILHKEELGVGVIQDFLKSIAVKYKIWLVGGTIPIATADPKRIFAHLGVWGPTGIEVAGYNKIHLFDVQVAENGAHYFESKTIVPGEDIKTCDSPWGNIGLAVCYDVRFPEIFRSMLMNDIKLIVLPSAFTEATGKYHWEALVKARAIENLSFVLAADQVGVHPHGQASFGMSMIVDYWGNILSAIALGEGVALAELNFKALEACRNRFPVLLHAKKNI